MQSAEIWAAAVRDLSPSGKACNGWGIKPMPPVAATMHPPERPSFGVHTAGEKKDLHFLDAQTEVMEAAIVPGSLCS